MRLPDPQDSVYDKILELPLFQGHSREDLTAILSKVKVEFCHYRKGQVIIGQDDPCRSILFLLDGDVIVSRTSLHKDILFTEQFGSFKSFGAETLFGLRQSYSYSIIAQNDVRTLVLDKAGVTSRLLNYEVFRYNMLNMLTTRIQRCQQALWLPEEDNVERSFVLLCKRNFIHPAGPKTIEGGMVALARMMNKSRIQVSTMLNALEKRQLISLGRKKITIPCFEKLISSC